MWKLTLAAWLAAVLGLPAVACAGYGVCTGRLSGDLNTAVSLYLSMVGIMVTIFLTWYVYRSEQRRNEREAKREEEDAKRMVAAVLRTGLRQAIYCAGGYLKITDELLRATTPAGRSLSVKQAQDLSEFMRTLQSIGDTELDDWCDAGEKAWRFALRFLPEPAELFRERILETKNWEWLVGGSARELLESLGSPLDPQPEIFLDKSGHMVYQEYLPGRYRVWAEDERVLLDGAVEGEEVMDGYAELRDRPDRQRYCGHYLDGCRHGAGVVYYSDGEIECISREGLWKKGELFNGMIYHVVHDDSEDDEEICGEPYRRSPYDWIFQLETPERVQANVECFPPFRMCDVRIVHGRVQVIEDSMQTVEEFCENWRPHTQPMPPSMFEEEGGCAEP